MKYVALGNYLDPQEQAGRYKAKALHWSCVTSLHVRVWLFSKIPVNTICLQIKMMGTG